MKQKRTKVKICGLTSLEDARFTAGALADYMGFIFYEDSPRFITPAQAGAIINWIEGPECAGVFVNQPLDDVNMIARQTGIDLVQLHGNESAGYCRLVDKPVIKAIHVADNAGEAALRAAVEPYLPVADYLLFDTKAEGKWGGTGKTFDWSLIKDVAGGLPYFLSGGLDAGNVQEACRTVRPFAVDLSSGVEREPGVKDYDKIEAFMDTMRDIWEKNG